MARFETRMARRETRMTRMTRWLADSVDPNEIQLVGTTSSTVKTRT